MPALAAAPTAAQGVDEPVNPAPRGLDDAGEERAMYTARSAWALPDLMFDRRQNRDSRLEVHCCSPCGRFTGSRGSRIGVEHRAREQNIGIMLHCNNGYFLGDEAEKLRHAQGNQPVPSPERPAGVRGGGAPPELQESRAGAARDPGGGEPPGEAARGPPGRGALSPAHARARAHPEAHALLPKVREGLGALAQAVERVRAGSGEGAPHRDRAAELRRALADAAAGRASPRRIPTSSCTWRAARR